MSGAFNNIATKSGNRTLEELKKMKVGSSPPHRRAALNDGKSDGEITQYQHRIVYKIHLSSSSTNQFCEGTFGITLGKWNSK